MNAQSHARVGSPIEKLALSNANNYHLPSVTPFRPVKYDMRDVHKPQSYSPVVAPPRDLKRLSSEELIGPAREVLIRHAGCDYRLRITKLGKLILTK
jgi:hemin uptake protein HemP